MNAKRLCSDIGRGFLFSLAFVGLAQAAITDLATQPLVTSTAATVLPNVLFVLDDSGSMAWTHMPDDAGDAGSSVTFSYGYYGLRSHQCNGVYYNPGFNYTPPVKADGSYYANASFTGALPDGFKASGTGNSPVNLSTSFKAEGDGTGAAAYYFAYSGSQTTPAQKDYNSSTNTFYNECHSGNGAAPGSSVFTKVTVSTTSGPGGTDERQNFANWYSYYRTRMLMMKTAAGRAFKSLDNHYRVGFMAINADSAFLNLAPFDSAQKTLWYNTLYNSAASGSTPLRTALSDMGRLYAGRLSLSGVTVNDPVQYSCQQNFGILSTDGYWNSGSGYKVNGTSAVGNQDGSAPRPFFDGSSNTTTTTTPTTTVQHKQTVTQKTTTTTWLRKLYSLGAMGTNGCSASKRKLHAQNQTATQTVITTTTALSDVTTISTHVVVVTNGVVTSDTTTSTNSTANGTTTTATDSDTGVPDASSTWISGADAATGSCASNPTIPNPNPSTPVVSGSPTVVVTSGPTTTVVSTDGPTVGTPTANTVASGGTSDNLADIAQYYYMTDLRSSALSNCTGALGGGTDVCADNVPSTGQDGASWQHLTLFTLGLGASGRMIFSPNYLSDNTGDYASVKNGLSANPPDTCSWQASGSGACNWPVPGMANGSDGKVENIDDLWHAAVNGRGTYFSATNPSSLSAGLSGALAGVAARKGASAAATTSNPNVTSGDNFVFSSTFTTQEWDGELIRQQIDPETGTIPVYDPANPHTYDWAAQSQLDTNTSRVVYTYDSAAANHLKPFTWASLNATEQGYFNAASISSLTQLNVTVDYYILDSAVRDNAAGANLVDFLKGDRSNEGAKADLSKAYRQRTHILGDIVNAEVVYVKSPLYAYADLGYSEFISSKAGRQAMVYAAANDGMLHAMNGDNGAEVWAYIPSKLLPNLYKLADKNYAAQHQYYVDGSPSVGDICVSHCDNADSAVWKTILIGGMRAGGRGYYALDITDPAAPKALWEFTDNNLGSTFSNPVITKLKNGTWVVLVASGYNNVSPGDGVGRLFVIDAITGSLIRSISTGTGDTTTPSGLSRISAWVDRGASNNTALRIYGGDLLGNLWRFDINGDVGADGFDAQLLAKLKDGSGNAQPITGKPALGKVSGVAVVYVGTGRYLGLADPANTSQQSFYAIKDSLSTATTPSVAIFDNPRAAGHFVSQTLTSTTCPAGVSASVCTTGQIVRTGTSNLVNFAQDDGWYMDFPELGERANTDPILVLGTLLFNTNVPNSNVCTAGGYGFRYFLDYRTGGALASTLIPGGGGGGAGGGGAGGGGGGGAATGVASQQLGNAIASSPVVVKLPNNAVVEITRMSDGTNVTSNVPYSMSSVSTRRLSWRELIDE